MTMPAQQNWMRFLNSEIKAKFGQVRHALFDFDGTLSVLRQGWEPVMEQVMLAAICPQGNPPDEIVAEVQAYIDASTGQLTILQMEWLAGAVIGLGKQPKALTAREYKRVYLEALMKSVSLRLERLETGRDRPESYLVAGSLEVIRGLAERGVKMYVASGSDHEDVVREARALGLAAYFNGGIYGALDASEANAKDRIIQRILNDHALAGAELLVVGDGPVEIIEAKKRGAVALGVASDEVARTGWNEHKVERLSRAGADVLVADFTHAEELVREFAG
jgi:phosphoglycolate phosphatase-like HAD superfamily hydrolase